MRQINAKRLAVIAGLGLALAAAGPPPECRAQIGAITEAFGGRDSGENVYQRAPVLTESGYVLDRGGFSAAAYFLFGYLRIEDQSVWGFDRWGSEIRDQVDTDYTAYQLVVSGLYGVLDRLTVGFIAYPYARIEADHTGRLYEWQDESETGAGDLVLYAKASLWRSKKGWSGISAIAAAQLPTGDESVGAANTALAGGLAASLRIDQWTFHGDATVRVPIEEADDTEETSKPVLSFAGAAVFGADPRLGVSLEGLGSYSDGDLVFDIAPGGRLRAGQRVFLDGTLVVNVTSPQDSWYDVQLIVGLSVIL